MKQKPLGLSTMRAFLVKDHHEANELFALIDSEQVAIHQMAPCGKEVMIVFSGPLREIDKIVQRSEREPDPE